MTILREEKELKKKKKGKRRRKTVYHSLISALNCLLIYYLRSYQFPRSQFGVRFYRAAIPFQQNSTLYLYFYLLYQSKRTSASNRQTNQHTSDRVTMATRPLKVQPHKQLKLLPNLPPLLPQAPHGNFNGELVTKHGVASHA